MRFVLKCPIDLILNLETVDWMYETPYTVDAG